MLKMFLHVFKATAILCIYCVLFYVSHFGADLGLQNVRFVFFRCGIDYNTECWYFSILNAASPRRLEGFIVKQNFKEKDAGGTASAWSCFKGKGFFATPPLGFSLGPDLAWVRLGGGWGGGQILFG